MKEDPDHHAVDIKLLELMVCPLTKGVLKLDLGHGELLSRSAKLAYPIRDGIPIMLPSEARQVSDDELKPPAPPAES